ncbi:SE1561 family protein [Halobacillus seohaensis]|uniref:SE1561 family protein n=1 Tax=Halobacillus seohaensis TaxID=447421 RepID=A0ABW2EKE5_9BACI
MVQKEKLTDLKLKLSAFMERLDDMEPEETSIEDIDELIRMLEELENKI